jgi:heme/copper-type cytochrome/quinol oxidase subunit 4
MKIHIVLMVAFSVLTSLVLAFITKNDARERWKYFLVLFGSFVVLSIVAGWLMYPFPF